MVTKDAPISRGLIDEALPWLRALAGFGFVAYSANSTIFIGAGDLLWLFESTKRVTIAAFPDAYWYSALLALVLFVGEIATSERYPRTYRMFLIPDAFYSSRQVFAGLSKALGVLAAWVVGNNEAALIIGAVLAVPVAGFIGYIVAKWGEILLFGKRRKPGRAKKEE